MFRVGLFRDVLQWRERECSLVPSILVSLYSSILSWCLDDSTAVSAQEGFHHTIGRYIWDRWFLFFKSFGFDVVIGTANVGYLFDVASHPAHGSKDKIDEK
jgi:hypothetical protein